MKFKPTIAKSIVSVLGGIGAFFISSKIFTKAGECIPDVNNPGMEICVDFAPSPLPIIIFVVAIVLIYVIWSLATKK